MISLLIFAFATLVSTHALLPSSKDVCNVAKDIPLAHCMRMMSILHRIAHDNSSESALSLAASHLGNNPNNCGENSDECDCTWGEEATCGGAITSCIADCLSIVGCATCLIGLGPGCQNCACYYICEYDGPGQLATKVCPQKYFNCTDQ